MAIIAGAAHDGFDGISNDLAGDERVFHTLAAHRDAIGNGDGVEDDGLAAGFVCALFGFQRELVNVHVAGRDVAPGGGDADDGLGKICLFEADGIKHGAGGGPFGAVKQDAGEWAERIGRFHLRHGGNVAERRASSKLPSHETSRGFRRATVGAALRR